ncbi:MAG: ion transporter [Christensenellaceae bacterium]|jgi:voltage-gated potassium channel|nr:ion transporter [Christensenellaceae bacterium]
MNRVDFGVRRLRRALFNLIRDDDKNNIAASIFDGVIIALIVLNVLFVIAETFEGIPERAQKLFRLIEAVSVAIFTAEYFLRLWTADFFFPDLPPRRARLKYALSFMALVDLLAILPFYLPFVVRIDLRVLRLVRLLRLARLLKMNRYVAALSMVGAVIARKTSQLVSAMMVVLVLLIVASVLMYSVENEAQPTIFENAFSGLWWATATLTTVGYGDIYPITIIGKVLGTVIALLGIGLIAVPTGILSAGFMEEIEGEKRTKTARYCPFCGEKLD